ncbi:MAG: hypothetical protein M3Y42_00885 [Actinomycetota bacterium]|nr:hypothetical protein [Actinomycetota bacterium]
MCRPGKGIVEHVDQQPVGPVEGTTVQRQQDPDSRGRPAGYRGRDPAGLRDDALREMVASGVVVKSALGLRALIELGRSFGKLVGDRQLGREFMDELPRPPASRAGIAQESGRFERPTRNIGRGADGE